MVVNKLKDIHCFGNVCSFFYCLTFKIYTMATNKTLKKVYLTDIRDELIELNETFADEPYWVDTGLDSLYIEDEAEVSSKLDNIIRKINNLLEE